MITASDLRKYESSGVVAAAKALQLNTKTVHRLARQLGVTFTTCTAYENCRREHERRAMAPKLRKLARQCMTQKEMCAELGVTRWVLRRVAREYRIDINSRSY